MHEDNKRVPLYKRASRAASLSQKFVLLSVKAEPPDMIRSFHPQLAFTAAALIIREDLGFYHRPPSQAQPSIMMMMIFFAFAAANTRWSGVHCLCTSLYLLSLWHWHWGVKVSPRGGWMDGWKENVKHGKHSSLSKERRKDESISDGWMIKARREITVTCCIQWKSRWMDEWMRNKASKLKFLLYLHRNLVKSNVLQVSIM